MNTIIQYAGEFIAFNFIITTCIRLSCAFKRKIRVNGYVVIDPFLLSGYIFYILISVFRKIDYGFGTADPMYYKTLFLNADVNFLDYLFSSKEEPGFKIILWTIRLFTDKYEYALFFIHTIAFIGMIYFIKNTPYRKETIMLWLFTFLNCTYLLYMMNITRSGLVIILSCDLFILLIKKKYKKALLLLFVCISIHLSAIILIPLVCYFLLHPNINRVQLKDTLLFILIVIILEFTALYVFKHLISESAYGIYTNEEGISLRTYMTALLVIILMSIQKRDIKKNKYMYIEETILCFVACCIPIQLSYSIAYRMAIIFIPMLYLCMFHIFSENHIFKKLRAKPSAFLVWGIVVFYFVYKSYSIFFIEFKNVYPYSNNLISFL